MKTIKSKILPIAIAVAVLICMFAVPVSAAPSSGYYDSGTVYATEFVKQDSFAFQDQFQPNAPYYDRNGYFEWSNTGSEDMVTGFPELYQWLIYNIYIPTDAVTIDPGDVFYLEFDLVYYSSLALFRRNFEFGYVSGDGDITYSMDVSPTPDGNIDGWPTYNSFKKHTLHFKLRFTSSGSYTFSGFMFYFELYRSRSDSPYFYLYDNTSYRLYGGDPESPNYPRYENPSNGELGDASGNLTEKEDELNDALTDSQSKADEPFKAFSLFTFQDGLGCWVTLFNHILPSSLWLYNLINISLSLGLFAFVVGMATAVVRSVSRNRGGKGDS